MRTFVVLTLASGLFACTRGVTPDEEATDDEQAQGGGGGSAATGGAGGTLEEMLAGAGGAADEGGRPGTRMPGGGGDGGVSPDTAPAPIPDAGGMVSPDTNVPPPNTRPAIVAVGSGGVRVLSLDDGRTWQRTAEDAPNGGDDMNLLRSVAYGNGIWVAAGWGKSYTSTDGKTWTRRSHNMDLVQGMAFGNGIFIATHIEGQAYRSTDGITWQRAGRPNTGKHTEVFFAGGKFAAWGVDQGRVETSTDGTTWAPAAGLTSAVYCGGDVFRSTRDCGMDEHGAWKNGTFIRGRWKAMLERSTDGRGWNTVLNYQVNDFDAVSFGFVPQ